MKVRQATKADRMDCILLTVQFLRSVDYPLEINSEKLGKTYDQIYDNPNCAVFVAENVKGHVIGMIVGVLNQTLFSDDIVATEIAWYVDPNNSSPRAALKLIQEFERWAKASGASVTTLSHTGNKDLGPFFKKRGYQLTESSYMKEI